MEQSQSRKQHQASFTRALSYYVRETLGKQIWQTDREMGRHRIIVYLSMEHLPGLMLQKKS